MSELRLNTDGHIIKFGADNDVSLTHVADTGLLLNSTMQLQFNDASQNINAPSATVLDINATDEIELNATLVDINANVEISGTATTTGVHTFSATPVFPDGSLALADLDIDGGTDIGAAIVDADLFIVDDGAGGTNRKTTAARLKTYIGSVGGATGVDFNDNVKVRFGTGNDLEIYHDGSNSIIHDGGAGDLLIRAEDDLRLQDTSGNDYVHCNTDGTVELYHNQVKTMETSATGITVLDGSASAPAISNIGDTNTGMLFPAADQIDLSTGGSTRFRIRDNGAICSERGIGHSSTSTLSQAGDQGLLIRDGDESIYASSSGTFTFNRSNDNNNDLTLISFLRNGSNPGSISGTNGTVSYNTFVGSHWSQFADNSKPTILTGTVIESIDEICDWPMVKFTLPAAVSPTGEDKVMREYISKPSTAGANIKHTFEGVEYDGVVELEDTNEHLPKCKISDAEDSTKIYGIFRAWDENDKVNDLSVSALGAFIVRIHKDETVAIGNLLSSKGDGTAKVQSDGNFKNTTIAKVTSTTKIETYSDGSYTVPCTLHCG